MLLVVDVGNTGTVMGLVEGDRIVGRWEVMTADRTSDEWSLVIRSMIRSSGHVPTAAALASVVPDATRVLRSALPDVCGAEPVVVGPGVDRDAHFRGGAIAVGVKVAAEALVRSTSALRRVELSLPNGPVGKSTVEAVQSGTVFGFAGLVDGLVARFIAESADPAPTVVATGGFASLVAPHCSTIDVVDLDLTVLDAGITGPTVSPRWPTTTTSQTSPSTTHSSSHRIR